MVEGKSFSDAVKGQVKKVWKPLELQRPNQTEWNRLTFSVDEVKMEWLRKCYVGHVRHVDQVFMLQEKIVAEGISSVKITPMGGDLMLIQPHEDEHFDDLLKEVGDLFSSWFESIHPWSQEDVPQARYVLVRCFGVPFHVWSADFFISIAMSFGRFVCLDKNTANMVRLDVAWMLIHTSSVETINRRLKIKINDSFFFNKCY